MRAFNSFDGDGKSIHVACDNSEIENTPCLECIGSRRIHFNRADDAKNRRHEQPTHIPIYVLLYANARRDYTVMNATIGPAAAAYRAELLINKTEQKNEYEEKTKSINVTIHFNEALCACGVWWRWR